MEDEFRFLRGDAAGVGRSAPLPEVRRVETPVSEGRIVSGLVYDPARPPEYVFLHGMGLNAHGFDPVALALDAPALSLDLPGHGRSDWRADADYRPDLLAADVVLALDALAPEPFALIGQSLGGVTAILVAAARPALVRRLMLVDVSPGIVPKRDAGGVTEFIAGKRDYGTQEEIVDRAIAFGIGSDRAALSRGVALNTRLRADGRWEWTHHFAHLDAPTFGDDGDPAPLAPLWAPLEALHAGGTPLALVRADAGLVDEELGEEWLRRLPGSSVVSIPGPHNLQEAAPRELAEAIRAFAL